MLTRQEIKANAKAAMKHQWGTSIGTLVLLVVAIFVISFVSGFFIGFFSRKFLIISLLSSFAGLALAIFINIPLMVGVSGVFARIYRKEHAHAGEIFLGFSGHYLRKVGGMLWMMLFIWLWSLLVIAPLILLIPAIKTGMYWVAWLYLLSPLLAVPAIIKGLAYSMVPYILADCPDVKAREATKLSMRMTKGHKGAIFVMALSFIGWYLLSGLTFGILALIFVNPYAYTTSAGYYNELKRNAIESGTISAAEFGMETAIVYEEAVVN